MKKKIYTFALLFCLCCSAFLLGCSGGEKKGTAFSVMPGYNTLARADVTLNGKSVTAVEIDELLPPTGNTGWGCIAIIDGQVEETDTQIVGTTPDDLVYAKKIKVGDKIFTIDAEGNYSLDDGTQFTKWLENAENAEYYWERMAAGDYYILKNSGEKYDIGYLPSQNGVTDKKLRFFKMENGYWPSGGKGYSANIEAIEEFIRNNGVNFNPSDAQKGSSGDYEFDGVSTGATIANFANYFNLAKSAADNAK